MMYGLLAADPFRKADFGEAALYALLGFVVVFLGIAFLIFVVWGVGQLMVKFQKAKSEPKKAVETLSTPKSIVEQSDDELSDDELSDEVIAVITAAIAAYYQQENKKCEFTVKRIKRL